MTSPILPLKILLIENDPAAATEIRRRSPQVAEIRSRWNGFDNFPTVLNV
jgi:hypothetical protein